MPSVLQHIINDWIYYLVRVGVNSVNGKLTWTVCSLGFLKRKQKYPKKFNVNVINCHIKEWFKCWFKLNNRVQIRIIFQYSSKSFYNDRCKLSQLYLFRFCLPPKLYDSCGYEWACLLCHHGTSLEYGQNVNVFNWGLIMFIQHNDNQATSG